MTSIALAGYEETLKRFYSRAGNGRVQSARNRPTESLADKKTRPTKSARVRPVTGEPPRRLHVVHFNDVYHMRPDGDPEEGPYGGAERFATKLKEIKEKDPNVLVVFGGDLFGPSLTSAVTRGRHMIQVIDELGVHYGCFGNHEFDYGLAGLNKNLYTGRERYGLKTEPSKVTWISTNIDGEDGQPVAGCKKSVLVDWHGVKVGMVSVSENWLKGCGKLKKGEAVWKSDVESCRSECRKLRAEGAEVVLAITHNTLKGDKALMSQVPAEELDLLTGGHDHFYARDEALRIVKGGQEFQYLCDIEFEVGAEDLATLVKCEKVEITKDIAPDPGMAKIVDGWLTMIEAKASKVYGKSDVDLPSTEEFLRWKEGALSNWICDVCAEDYNIQEEGNQAADFAMLMGFSVSGKTVTPAGDITLGHIMAWFPKDVILEVVEIKGEDVVKSLERGCGGLPGECGSIHHVSHNLNYGIDLSKGKGEGRVHDVMFKGAPIDPEKVYKVAITAAMGLGKYGYDWFKTAPRIVDEEFGFLIADLVKNWLKKHKGESINPSMGRINIHS